MDTYRSRPPSARPRAGRPPNRRPTLARPQTNPLPGLLDDAAAELAGLGKHKLAAAVREAREKLFTRARSRPDNPTLPLYLRTETWERAQAAGPTADAVEAGFAALLAGKFRPQPPARGGGPKGKYSTRAEARRQAEVEAYVKAHADELVKLGWPQDRLPSASQVANAWLEHKYGKPART